MATITTPAAGVSPYQESAAAPTVLRASADGTTVLATAASAAATVSELAETAANTLVVVNGEAALNSLIATSRSGVFDGANVTINLEEQNFNTTNQVTSTINYASGAAGSIQYNNGADGFAGDAYFTYTNSNIITPGIRTNSYLLANGAPFLAGGNAAIGNFVFSGDTITISDVNQVMSITGNGTGNVQVTSNTNVWTFDNDGNLTLPSNTSSINYANGSPYGGGNYSNSNVSSFLAAFGSNVVSTTGNITGGNLTTTGTANIASLAVTGSATVQGSIGIFSTSTSLSATGNIIVGNILTGGLISATGNITGNYFIGNGSELTGIVANTGNVTFSDVNIIGTGNLKLQPDSANASAYLDIYLTAGPDIHIAGNGETVILGTDAFANVTVNVDGNVSIQAGNVGGTQTWNFGTDGILTLPGNIIAINYANGNRVTGNITFRDEIVIGTGTSNLISGLYLAPSSSSADANMYLRVRGNIVDEPTHIHFDTGNNAYYNQFIGDDNKYIQLANTGNIVINSNDVAGNAAQWTFAADGTTTFPTANIDLHNGGVQTGEVLQFGNSSLQSIITGPTPAVDVNAQRIIIQGQRGNGTGEGGDVYVWGGDADTNGGDIKIYAGDADNVSAGSGGYVNLAGGDGFDNGGDIDITGGSSANGTGGDIFIDAGLGETDGGGVNLQGGYGVTGQGGTVQITGGASGNGTGSYGNVVLGSGSIQWIFDNTGNLTLPADATISDFGDTASLNVEGSDRVAQLYWNGNIGNGNPNTGGDYYTWAYVHQNGFTIQYENANTSTDNEWRFDIDGNITLPTGTPSINYANGSPYGGGGANTGNVTFDDQVVIGTGDGSSGSGGLYLAPGLDSTANLQYLRVSGGDVASHIHLDTGNNEYFDLYIGTDSRSVKIANTGNIDINTNDGSGNSASWTFAANGNLTFPTGNLVITPDDPAGNVAVIASTDHPLAILSTGANGSTATFWVEDYANFGTSNIAAVYVNPVSQTGNVQIQTGNNSSITAWNFTPDGNLTLPNGAVIKDTVGNAVAFGRDAAATGPQGNAAVAIGQQAGETSQGASSVAIGFEAGLNTQGANSVAIGTSAGQSTQQVGAVAVGLNAGTYIQGQNAVAIGSRAGNSSQQTQSVAIGVDAAADSQGQNSVAIGSSAAAGSQGEKAVAIGLYAGNTTQGNSSVAIGDNAGYDTQGANSVAIGSYAGQSAQGNNSIIINATGAGLNALTANTFTVAPVRNDVANIAEVMFYNATSNEITYGNTISVAGNITGGNLSAINLVINSITSDDSTFVTIEDGVNITTGSISAPENLSLTANAQTWTFTDGVGIVLPGGAAIRDTSGGSLAIGVGAGALALGNTAVAIGYQSAFLAQGNNSVAIGRSAGETQGEQAVAIGLNAGRQQGNYAVAIGKFSANSSQGEYSVAIGPNAGFENQLSNAVSIGSQAGASSQGINSVAVGVSAAYNTQGNNAVAVGNSAGYLLQGNNSVAIGDSAGIFYQGNYSVAVGYLAGNNTQGGDSVAVGVNSGGQLQGTEAVAVGSYAGYISQGNLSVAVGRGAGENSQGANSVAVGHLAGRTNQGNNSIILNATGANLEQTTANTFTVAPVRNDVANIAEIVFYNATSKEITYGNTISVTGNITGNYFIGNGAALTDVGVASVPGQNILPTIQTITISATSNGGTGGGTGWANVTVANTIPVTEYGVIVTAGTVSQTYATGALGSIPGTVQLTITTGLNTTPFTVYAYVTSNAGTFYSNSATGNSGICLLAGTQIALSDGTHKAIEDITYTDKLLSWDFDRGCYAETTAMWIKRSETGSQYNLLTFSDGTTLRTFDQHRIFNKQAGAFTYPMTAETPVGTVTVNEHGQEIILTSKQVIRDTIEYYNVITDYHMNLFSDSVLTSCRFNNIYPITDMKFVKDNRTLRTRAEFENVEDRFFHGLRLAEQTADIETVEWYVNRLLRTEVLTHAELAV